MQIRGADLQGVVVGVGLMRFRDAPLRNEQAHVIPAGPLLPRPFTHLVRDLEAVPQVFHTAAHHAGQHPFGLGPDFLVQVFVRRALVRLLRTLHEGKRPFNDERP